MFSFTFAFLLFPVTAVLSSVLSTRSSGRKTRVQAREKEKEDSLNRDRSSFFSNFSSREEGDFLAKPPLFLSFSATSRYKREKLKSLAHGDSYNEVKFFGPAMVRKFPQLALTDYGAFDM